MDRNWKYEPLFLRFNESNNNSGGLSNERLPLHVAILKQKGLSIIKNYLDARHINSVDENGNTCLHIAVEAIPYNLEIIRELIKQKANLNAKNKDGNTPLHSTHLNTNCDVNLINILLSNGANINITNRVRETVLHLTIRNCNNKITFDRCFSVLKLLLEKGANPNIPNISDTYPIMIAIDPVYLCDTKVIDELIRHGANLGIYYHDGDSLLHKAIEGTANCSFELVKLLLKHYPQNINWKNSKGHTPLHIAILKNASLNIVKELVNNGAEVNSSDKKGNTPLHFARKTPYSVLETLVKHKANINALNKYNNTPLIELVSTQYDTVSTTTLAAFLELGAEVNAVGANNKTALYHALNNVCAFADNIKLLLAYGAAPVNVNFNLKPPVCRCYFNKCIADVFVPFLVLKMFQFEMHFKEPYEELVELKSPTRKMREFLSTYRDKCVSELKLMDKDKLNNEVTVYNYVYDNVCVKVSGDKYPNLFVKKILDRIKMEKYPNSQELLRASLTRNKLIEYLLSVIVYVNKSDSSFDKKDIILNYDVTKHLSKFLNRETLFSLVETFSDSKPVTESVSENSPNSGVKHKYKE